MHPCSFSGNQLSPCCYGLFESSSTLDARVTAYITPRTITVEEFDRCHVSLRFYLSAKVYRSYATPLYSRSRTRLAAPDIENPVLGDRFRLSSNLVETTGTIHMFEWVLKGFQSSSVVFCSDEQTAKSQLQPPDLAGFGYIHPASGSTVGQPLAWVNRRRCIAIQMYSPNPTLSSERSTIHILLVSSSLR